jgi:Ca-activated chloride channel family protein
MSVFARILFGITIVAVATGSPAYAQVQERSVYASVLDKNGTPVTALTANDFIVREDGVQREVLRVAPANDPLRIALLVDTSQAIERHVNDLRTALRSFVSDMSGKHDIAIIGFGERPTVITEYTRDSSKLEKGIGRLFARRGAGAYVLDAIVETARDLQIRDGARSVIVVITAEGPEFSERYHQTVLDRLGNTATLHSFVLARRGASPLDDAAQQRELTLAKGASATGGRREHLLTSMALKQRLSELAAELNNQLRIDYARPATLIPPDKLDVSVKRTDLTVRAPHVPVTKKART